MLKAPPASARPAARRNSVVAQMVTTETKAYSASRSCDSFLLIVLKAMVSAALSWAL